MEKIDKTAIRNEAAVAALFFGLISGAYIIITGFMGTGVAETMIKMVLWLAKFVGCIWLMCFLMKKLCKKYEGVTNSDTKNYGILIALFSAIIVAVVSYIASAYIFPDQLAKSMDEALAMYGSMLDSNSLSMMDEMMEKMPAISLISNFIWCFLYGTILSAIVSAKIPSKDPFAEYKKEDEE